MDYQGGKTEGRLENMNKISTGKIVSSETFR